MPMANSNLFYVCRLQSALYQVFETEQHSKMSRRKPTLQLANKVARLTEEQSFSRPKVKTGAGLGLLGNYDDSDDEVENDDSDDEQNLPVSTLDSKVADFLKEINDLDTDTAPVAKKQSKEIPKQEKEIKQETEVPLEGNDTQDFKIVWGPWKQCVDENTNHPYYWNTDTNEVSWTLPEDVMKQYDNQMSIKPHKEDAKKKVETKPKTKPVKESKSEKPVTKTEDLLLSRNTLKAALEEKRQELERRQKKVPSKLSSSRKEKSSKDKKQSKTGANDIDIDAELDSALDSFELPAKRLKLKKDELVTSKQADASLKQHNEPELSSKHEQQRLDKDSERESDDMDISDDLSKYDMTDLLPTKRNDTPVVSRTASPVAINQTEPPVDTTTKATLSLETTTKTSSDDYQKNEIESLSINLIGKLSFLDISKNSLTDFHRLLMEIEVRGVDWKAGQLSADYYFKKLKEAEEQLQKYEMNAVPRGWSCQWDSNYKRYFYKNKLSGEMQWTFPKDAMKENKEDSADDNKAENSSEKSSADKLEKSDTTAGDNTSGDKTAENLNQRETSTPPVNKNDTDSKPAIGISAEGSQNMMNNYPGFNSYQQYWGMANQYGMGYRQTYGMSPYDESYRNSPRSHEVPPPPGEDSAPPPPADEDVKPPLPPVPPADAKEPIPPPPPPPPPSDVNVDDGIEMEISDVEDSEDSNSAIINVQATGELQRGPVEYNSLSSGPLLMARPTTSLNKPLDVLTSNVQPTTFEKFKKTKKAKKDKSAVKKPPREMVGMVAKWQKAKKEIEEEEKRLIMESEEELNKEMNPKYRIHKWKEQQLQSGKAATNANFEPVSDDWRKRVKQRKNKVT
uniref:Formin-binding protein 4-like n=1 Tax=Phallusia mammillata TaxID=59560 RepID=A0A6F9DDM4_9ASCI|nr:formin-binding protein 4-like [Phallusia mammillata]